MHGSTNRSKVEIEGLKRACKRDSVALVQVLSSLEKLFLANGATGRKTLLDRWTVREDQQFAIEHDPFILSSGWKGAKELGLFIFPLYSPFNGEPRSYLEFPNYLIV